MFTIHDHRAPGSGLSIIPVRPVVADDGDVPGLEGGLLRRTFGYRFPSRRTFGRFSPSRRTFGRYSPSRRTFGRYEP
jgi:hypothetical protein